MTASPSRATAVLFLFLVFLASTATRAEESRIVVPHSDLSPVLDGDLSEKWWRSACLAGPFRDETGKLARARPTVVRMFYTDDALFFGLVCVDEEEPEAPAVRVHLTPPTGKPFEAVLGRRPSEGIACSVRHQKAGWTAEARVPFALLVPEAWRPRPGDVWRLRMARAGAAKGGLLYFARTSLLPNGDAELDKDQNRLPDGWRIERDGVSPRTPEEADIETRWFVQGKRALWVSVKGRTVISLPDSLPLRQGTAYRFFGWLLLPDRRDVETVAVVRLPGVAKPATITEGKVFQRFEIIFTAGAKPAAPQVVVTGDGGSCYIDGCAIEMLPAPLKQAAKP